jgi:DNA-binding MarR family transcriptional regulator
MHVSDTAANNLDAAKLREVRPGEDGRTRLVRLTPAGERSLEEAYPLWQQAQYVTVSALGEERYEALLGDAAKAVSLAAKGSREARSRMT